jgi:hypothetical protein
VQQCFTNDQRQTAIATRHRMTDPVTFGGVEKQHLVCLGYRLIVPNMPHINAAVRKHQLRGSRALLRALMTAASAAHCVPDRNRRRLQQRVRDNFRYVLRCVFRLHALDPPITQAVYRPVVGEKPEPSMKRSIDNRETFPGKSIHTEISPLRCAPVEMTKGRAVWPGAESREQKCR